MFRRKYLFIRFFDSMVLDVLEERDALSSWWSRYSCFSVILRRRQLPILYSAVILMLFLGWKL